MFSRRLKFYFVLLFLFNTQQTLAWQTLTDKIDIHCQQTAFSHVDCNYRLLDDDSLPALSATLSGQELSTEILDDFQTATSLTAILLLVDTSDPARQAAIAKTIEHIGQLVAASETQHLIGLANFDKDLHVRAAIGASKQQLLDSSKELKALGMTTELYRNVLKSIELLQQVDADRKAIFVFSDGQAEDKAYFHHDVVNAARRSGIIINSIGYPRSVTLSVALQTVRRLSDDTGGLYFETDQEFVLPLSFVDEIYANVDKGSRLRINLSSVDFAKVRRAEMELTFSNAGDRLKIAIPISMPLIRPILQTVQTDTSETKAPPPPLPVQEVEPVQDNTTLRGMDLWLWYGVPIALVILILLTLLTLFLLFKKSPPPGKPEKPKQDEFRPYAYLIAQDEKALRYPVTRSIWRIGRSRDNEMTLNDSSISRRHAEIQRDANGNFILIDTNSSNGVFVNNEKISMHILEEGDMIEIGDACLRFTKRPIDYQANENTAMLSTKLPA